MVEYWKFSSSLSLAAAPQTGGISRHTHERTGLQNAGEHPGGLVPHGLKRNGLEP